MGAEAGDVAGWSTGAVANTTVLWRSVAWAGLVLSPLLAAAAGLAWVAAPSSAAPEAARNAPTHAAGSGGSDAGPGGFAVLFTTAYVEADSGSEKALARFYPPAADMTFPDQPGAQRAADSVAVGVRTVSLGYWSVTVATRVVADEKKSPGGDAAGLRYFQVPVKKTRDGGGEGRLVAVTLPSEVAAPAPVAAPKPRYGTPSAPDDRDPAVRTLQQFFSAYLAGHGPVERYAAPGTSLRAVQPAPYDEVTVSQLAEAGTSGPGDESHERAREGAQRRLLVDVQARAKGGERPMTYAVTLRARGGRWEIAALDTAPALDNDSGRGR